MQRLMQIAPGTLEVASCIEREPSCQEFVIQRESTILLSLMVVCTSGMMFPMLENFQNVQEKHVQNGMIN